MGARSTSDGPSHSAGEHSDHVARNHIAADFPRDRPRRGLDRQPGAGRRLANITLPIDNSWLNDLATAVVGALIVIVIARVVAR
jgi:hypothetical protein